MAVLVNKLILSRIKDSLSCCTGHSLASYICVSEPDMIGAFVVVKRDHDRHPYAAYWFNAIKPGFMEGAYYAAEDQAVADIQKRAEFPRVAAA